jgi:hypothetical protein
MTPDPEEGATDSTTTTDTEQRPDHGKQTGRPKQVTPAEEIDWRGWLLVGVVLVCFFVIPVLILFIPQAQGVLASLGLTRRQAYLAMPMIPAIVLGITAVWAAIRTQSFD